MDVSQFVDPNVTPRNVQLQANSHVTVHANGCVSYLLTLLLVIYFCSYVTAASVKQSVTLTTVNTPQTVPGVLGAATGFDSSLTASGELTLTLTSTTAHAIGGKLTYATWISHRRMSSFSLSSPSSFICVPVLLPYRP